MDVQRAWGGHWQQLVSTFLARAFGEEAAELLPGSSSPIYRGRCVFFFERHNRDVIVGAAFGTDATADATVCDVDFTAGQAGDACTAAQHAHGILTLPAGGGDADVANHHAFAVHT